MSFLATRKLFLSALLGIVCVACGCNRTNSSTGAAHEEGGVSTGGGDSVTAHPVGADGVHQILQSARPELIFYFNSNAQETQDSDVDQMLFRRSKTLFDVIRNVKIVEASNGPCHDDHGTETDGSIYGAGPNAICISTYRLGQKLTIENVHSQTIALVAHEYSHLLGTNEDQAKALQTEVWKNLMTVSQEQFFNFERGLQFEIAAFHGAVDPILADPESFSNEQFYEKLNLFGPKKFPAEVSGIFNSMSDGVFSVAQRYDNSGCYTCDTFNGGRPEDHLAQATALEIGMEILAGQNGNSDEINQYKKVFANRAEMDAFHFEQEMKMNETPMSSDHYMIHKITDRKTAVSELKQISDYVGQLEFYFLSVEVLAQ